MSGPCEAVLGHWVHTGHQMYKGRQGHIGQWVHPGTAATSLEGRGFGRWSAPSRSDTGNKAANKKSVQNKICKDNILQLFWEK